jgi:ribosome-binding factor A
MPVPYRKERIREALHTQIGRIIAEQLRDPRIPPIVTVTEVDLAPDLRNATVFVSIFGDEKQCKGGLIALNNAAPFIQKLLGQAVVLKRMPKLFFKSDNSLSRGQHISELLREIDNDLH